MRSFFASVLIAAPPERVWEILVDGARYPEWDPNMIRVEGTIAPDQRIKVFTKLSPSRSFPVKVVDFQPGVGMRWTGGMPLGLFRGNRTFRLTPVESGQTRFDLREVFSGPLSPIFGRLIPDLQPSFEAFAAGLKQRAESPR